LIYRALVTLVSKWHAMSYKEQVYASWHATFDLLLVLMLLAFLWNGMYGSLVVFVFWVPFLAVSIFFRFKQARKRWRL
jgi:hypothetical protein